VCPEHGPGHMEAERVVAERRRKDPSAHLTQHRVRQHQDGLAPGDSTIGRASRHVRNHPRAGEIEGHHHQREDFDQDERRRGHLGRKRELGDGWSIRTAATPARAKARRRSS